MAHNTLKTHWEGGVLGKSRFIKGGAVETGCSGSEYIIGSFTT